MGFDALNFVIELVLFFLFVIILIVLARKNKMITVIFFYFFLSSIMIYLNNLKILDKLTFYEPLPEILCSFLTAFSSLFSYFYGCFVSLILSLCKLINENVKPINDVITNDYFVMAINGILFILFAIIFRKRTKKRIERSRYSD